MEKVSIEETMKRMKEIKRRTGMGNKGLCKKFRLSTNDVMNWSAGRYGAPSSVLYMMEKILEYEEEYGVLIHTSSGKAIITDDGHYYSCKSSRARYHNGWRGQKQFGGR